MGNELNVPVRVSDLAKQCGVSWRGVDLEITNIQQYNAAREGSLCFNNDLSSSQSSPQEAAVVSFKEFNGQFSSVIEAINPRLVFTRLLNHLQKNIGFKGSDELPRIGEGAIISPTSCIGRGVVIGPRSIIGHNVVIADGVIIGADCVVKSNTVIGEDGFGFVRDDDGTPLRMPHLGTVIIGDRVEIGSLNTICRATLGQTVVESDVKTDDHVHIAHNCLIRSGALITACAELSGGVIVGRNAWIGPNSSVIQKVEIGENSFVGIGSTVTKPVQHDATVAGNPARVLSK